MEKTSVVLVTMLIFISSLVCGCGDPSTSYENDSTSNFQADEQDDYVEIDPSLYSCNWDWEFFTSDVVSYSEAPNGYTFAVCKVYLQNNGTVPVSTSPVYWDFMSNGIIYNYDSATFYDVVGHNSVDITYGGEFETRFVYLVRDDVTNGKLIYSPRQYTQMNRIKYYKTAEEIEVDIQLTFRR